jgi:hypothetical protein
LASKTQTITGRPAELLQRAKQTAMARGWTISKETATELEIKTRISVRSFGETVRVNAVENTMAPGTSVVTVWSSARFQLSDLGKSASNTDILLAGIAQDQGISSAEVPVYSAPVGQNKKFCANCGKQMIAKARFCPGCGEKAD